MSAVIGLDRRIKKDWLDATLDRLDKGDSADSVRSYLHDLLADEHPGKSSRTKSIGIIMRIWVSVQKDRISLRDRAVKLLPVITSQERLWLHWGMAGLAYPFFRDTADIIGRLLGLQENFTPAQVQARLVKEWGDRTITKRASQQVINIMLDWGAIQNNSTAGHFVSSPQKQSGSAELQLWLLEAILLASESKEIEAQQLLALPVSFPFSVTVGLPEIRTSEQFEVHREGLDTNMISIATEALKPAKVQAKLEGPTLFDEARSEDEAPETTSGVTVPPSSDGEMVAGSTTDSMILQYWNKVGGTLLRRVQLTTDGCTADAIIIPQGEKQETASGNAVRSSLKDQHILVVQAGEGRLSMELMGRAVFSAALVKDMKPRSITSVALCQQEDGDLKRLLCAYPHVEVEVVDD